MDARVFHLVDFAGVHYTPTWLLSHIQDSVRMKVRIPRLDANRIHQRYAVNASKFILHSHAAGKKNEKMNMLQFLNPHHIHYCSRFSIENPWTSPTASTDYPQLQWG